jgi:hypothetical protein
VLPGRVLGTRVSRSAVLRLPELLCGLVRGTVRIALGVPGAVGLLTHRSARGVLRSGRKLLGRVVTRRRLRVGRLIGARARVATGTVAAVAVVTVSIFGHRITSISCDRPQRGGRTVSVYESARWD